MPQPLAAAWELVAAAYEHVGLCQALLQVHAAPHSVRLPRACAPPGGGGAAGLYALLALPLESSFAGGRALGKAAASPPPRARGGRDMAREARVQVRRGPVWCWLPRRERGCASAPSILHSAPASAGSRPRCSQAAPRHPRGLPADAGPRCSAQGPADGALAAALAAGLPVALYAAAFRGALARPTHAWSLLLLASAPVLCLSCLKARRRRTRAGRMALPGHAWRRFVHGICSCAPFHAVGHPHICCAQMRQGQRSGMAPGLRAWRPGTAPADARVGRLRQDGLWWLPLRRARTDALRKLLLLLSLGAALAGLEARAPSLARTLPDALPVLTFNGLGTRFLAPLLL